MMTVLWTASAILAGEETPFHKRYLQCSEVSGIGPPEECRRAVPRRVRWADALES